MVHVDHRMDNEFEKLVSWISHTWSVARRNYGNIKKKMISICIFPSKDFISICMAILFILYTNLGLFADKLMSPFTTARIQCRSWFLDTNKCILVYHAASSNSNVGCLSHLLVNALVDNGSVWEISSWDGFGSLSYDNIWSMFRNQKRSYYL